MDLVNMVRTPRGNKYILTLTEYNTRFVEAFAIPNMQASTIARILVDEICFRYSAPKVLLSDLGANLISNIVSETCKLFKIDRVHTTPYHPQTNALLEKFNETLCKNLAMYVQADHTDWDLYLKGICYAYNTSVCTESVQYTPFFLMFGRTPIHPIDTVILPNTVPQVETVQETVIKLQKAREVARQNVLEKQQKIKERYDKTANPVVFEPGDMVWIYIPQVMVGGSKKFFHNYSGPYILLRKTGPTNFEVAHAHNNRKLKNEVHVNRMKPFHHRSIVPEFDTTLQYDPTIVDVEELNPTDLERMETHRTPLQGSTTASSRNLQAPVHPLEQLLADQPLNHRSQPAQPPIQPETQPSYELQPPPQHEEVTPLEPQNEKSSSEPDKGGFYDIKDIIHKRYNKDGKLEYLIDWKGYPKSARSYEPYDNLSTVAKEWVNNNEVKLKK